MYVIGGKEFSSKAKLTKECRRLKEHTGQQYALGTYEYAFLIDLIRVGHLTPEKKIGKGIQYFFVDRNFHGVTRFMLVREDCTDDFSFVNCIKNLGQDRTQAKVTRVREKRQQAYRDAVSDQIHAFREVQRRDSGGWVCNHCGTNIPKIVYHVDHDPDFVRTVLSFEAVYSGVLPAVFQDKGDLTYTESVCEFLPKDWVFQAAWQRYHREFARLQMLCSACNLAKTKVSYRSSVG